MLAKDSYLEYILLAHLQFFLHAVLDPAANRGPAQLSREHCTTAALFLAVDLWHWAHTLLLRNCDGTKTEWHLF
jgi:hypothetical protein